MSTTGADPFPAFMNIRQVADYLHLNEKKIYALASDGQIPATKVTGKWLFPRDLVDQWLLESSHGGVMNDRLLVAGSSDPLLHHAATRLSGEVQSSALVSYSTTSTQLGLALLARGRVDACALHWGPAQESHFRHPALLNRHPQHRDWILVRAFQRELGVALPLQHLDKLDAAGNATLPDLLAAPLRWCQRQSGSGSQRFFEEALLTCNYRTELLRTVSVALSERELAGQICTGRADAGPLSRATAKEFGLGFVSMGWECVDLALRRGIFFRHLFRQLMSELQSANCREQAERLGGYDLGNCGQLVWSS